MQDVRVVSVMTVALAVLPFAAPAGDATPSAPSTTTYVALVDGGKQAGQQKVQVAADGSTRVSFTFKDNGRGPELEERYRLRPDGTLADYRVHGVSTFGAKVDESFQWRDGKAVWKSTSDQGERADAPADALYVPLGGSPQMLGVAIAALAARSDGQLPLLPSGTLRMRKLDEVTLQSGDRGQTVQLLELIGNGFSPEFAWATTDARPRLFAMIQPGFLRLIDAQWKAEGERLEQRQLAAERKALVDLQQRLGHRLHGDTMIRNARVFDSAKAVLGPASDVLVRDGRIVSVTATGSEANIRDVNVIDAGGRTLLPGLFDMHTHVDHWSGGLDIAAGVTSVRDMGNDNATVQKMLVEEREGRLLMPRIITAGFIEGESKQSARNGFVIADLAQAKQAVDWYAAHGYPQVKIYNSFPKDILKQTVAYAHDKGLRVSGHVPAFLRAQDVVDDGFDEIQHINQLMLNFLVKPDTDTRTLERFYLPARGVADLDMDGKAVQDFITQLAKKKVAIDPTLATFEFLHQRNGELNPIFSAVDAHLPPDVRRSRRAAELDIPDDATAARYTRSYDKMVEFVGRAWKAGVPVLAGTDETPGFTLQRELELYVRAGIPAAQVLKIATYDAAKVARVGGDRGQILPGQRADLILVDGDPTANIADIRKVATVIKGDTVYYPSEVHAALGVQPFAQPLKVQAVN